MKPKTCIGCKHISSKECGDNIWAKSLKRFIKNSTGKDVFVISYRSAGNLLDGIKCDIVLKDEMVQVEDLRKILDNTGKSYVNIVGIN